MNVEDVWRRQRQWSVLANAKSRTLGRWRRTNLTLVFAGALFGALAVQTWFPRPAQAAVGVLGGVLLAVAAVVQKQCIGPDRVKDRVTARSAAETLRSAVHRYQAGAPGSTAERDAVLAATSDLVTSTAGSLAAQVLDVPVPTTPLPEPGIAAYVRDRTRDQAEYHHIRAVQHLRWERRWRAAEITATVVAAVISAVGGAVPGTNLSAWVGVATTIAGAVAAHLAGQQHARIAASYAITTDALRKLLGGFDPDTADDAAAVAFVDAVETALARQNQTWESTLVPRT